MWLLLTQAALAGPIGQPVPDPAVERVGLTARATTGTMGTRALGCEADIGCDALWEERTWSAELSVALLRGVGLYAEVGRVAEVVEAASYSGQGTSAAIGARLAVPVAGALGLAANARYGATRTRGDAVSGALGDAGTSALRGPALSLVGTLGHPRDGGLLWLGAQATPGWKASLLPLGQVDAVPLVEVQLEPTRPLSGVFGLAGVSEPLGLPWRRSARLSAGAELWVGGGSGLSAWLSLGW